MLALYLYLSEPYIILCIIQYIIILIYVYHNNYIYYISCGSEKLSLSLYQQTVSLCLPPQKKYVYVYTRIRIRN